MASIIQLFDQRGLDYEYMDDEKAQLIINHPLHIVAATLESDKWRVMDEYVTKGGLYTVSEVAVMERGLVKITLLSSTLHRTTLWNYYLGGNRPHTR
jgi:hypothetical protein